MVDSVDSFRYLVFGRERGDSGTPHLQGFFVVANPVSLSQSKTLLNNYRCHLEIARGTPQQAADYCKKDGDFEEFGELPQQGKRSDWDRFKEFVVDLGREPTTREIIAHNTSLWSRYSTACAEVAKAVLEPPQLTSTEPRLGFQTHVVGRIGGTPNPRTIDFIVDSEGNSGKSWICQYALTRWPDDVQVLSIGKRDDTAYMIDASKKIFLFDVPRGQMAFFQYAVMEMLKNRMVFSNKYKSTMKVLRHVPYVAVFSNEHPDMEAMSTDRYNVIEVNDENRGS